MGNLSKNDLTYLSWTKARNSSGTAGSFLKSQYSENGKKYYYKLSRYDSVKGIIGHESVNEIIVDRVLNIIGIEHLSYELLFADIVYEGKTIETYLCRSEDFKKPGDSKLALDALYQAEKDNNETPLEFCKRNGWSDYIYKMIIADYLILNRDRHGANIEILINKKDKTVRPAPLFDHGVSLLFSCSEPEQVKKFDVMSDIPVNNFIGGTSLLDNLNLVPKKVLKKLNPLRDEDKDIVFDGLEDAISKELKNKIWKMLLKRWSVIESFRN